MKYGRNVGQALILVFQFSIDMVVPIGLCSLAGWWLDRYFGTSWIFVTMFFVGAAAGGRNVYRFAKKLYTDKSGDVRNRDRTKTDTEKMDS